MSNEEKQKLKEFHIIDEEESNIHLIQLKGKIIRDTDCPLKKSILCEDCEFYDGWGVDTKNYEIDVYCNHPNIIDAKKLKINIEDKQIKIREKTFKNTPMGRHKIPEKDGEYMLLDKRGNNIDEGWRETDNLRRRIKEVHYDKSKIFSYIKIRKINKLENKNV